jgi:hypothetical protein
MMFASIFKIYGSKRRSQFFSLLQSITPTDEGLGV